MSNTAITLCSTDIIQRIKTVPQLGGRVGFTIGGTESDPFNRNLTLPYAWVLYTGDVPQTEPRYSTSCVSQITLQYVVLIATNKGTDYDYINTHLPLLHDVVAAVAGGEPVAGSRWLYLGQSLTNIEGRMVWQQQFTINTTI
jgi:hypothetical protein